MDNRTKLGYFYSTMKKYILIMLTISLSFLSAEQTIRSIEIEGLKRTKDETVLRILKIRPGDLWEEDLKERLEQRLRQSGIFQNEMEISLSEESGEVDLKLVLKDKWTLLAIPFFSISQGEPSGGAFILDSNAFGRQHLLVFSGTYAADSQNLFLMYRIPNIKGSPFSLLQSALYSNEEIALTDRTGSDSLGSFRRRMGGASLRLNYDFGDRLGLSAQGGLMGRTIDDVTGLDQTELNDWLVPAGLRLQWKDVYLYPLFSKGYTFSGETIFNFNPSEFYLTESAEVTFSTVPVEWLQLQLFGQIFYSNGSIASGTILGKTKSNRSLPDEQIAATFHYSGDASAEFRVKKLGFGNITLPLFYEAGVFNAPDGDGQFYQGIGGGLRLYIDKVAIPAMGLEYHQSLSGAGGNVTFSIGAGF